MTTENAQPPLDRRLGALAKRQYGVVSRAQLRAVGVGDTGIADRVRAGRLIRLYRGVYAVGHEQLRREGHWLAAVLACGPGAVLSHASAAALWEIRASAAATLDVTVPSRAGRIRRRGVRVHRSGRLAAEELTVRDGIPVTTVARTLLDLADVLPRQALKRAIDESEYLRLFDLTSLIAVVESNPGRRGAKLLTAAEGPPELTRNDFEQDFLKLIDRHGLPRPRVNARIGTYEADFLWPQAKLIVETDGYSAHGTRSAFERDRARDRILARAGFTTLRVTSRALRYDEDTIVADLEAFLGRVARDMPPRLGQVGASFGGWSLYVVR